MRKVAEGKGEIPSAGIAIVILAVIFIFLKFVVPRVTAPIPSAIIYMYLIVALIGILIYVSVEDKSWEEFVRPIREVFEGE